MPEIFSIKHDQTLGLAPIFRPLQRGERSSGKLDVRIKELESDIRITCFEPLGVDDQLILFSILSLCTEIDRSLVLSSEPQTEVGIALRADLFIRESNKKDSLMIETTEYELLNRSGKSDGMNNYENLRDTLARLASVTIRVQNESEDYAVRLLAYHVDIKTNQIKVAVNTKSAAAILGERYSYISLSDHRQLNSEPAKIIHGWLSSWMSQGDNRRIKLDSLATHIYPTFEFVQNNSKAVYRSRTKQAVESLKSIGWKVDIAGRGAKAIVVIGRPKAAKGLPYQQL